ncbi:DUF1641 domain-containing protein [Halobacillus sp. Marseille-Q1614]|uniref:DUF1641 domain-containing protein n=1 Tax=Halobacillus sp. Marseille-Q1614 TaxID=2709134 RepID=UPI0015714D34|nr:DUF1641 domain-containing protein [Halobacillus sp. Marseille-Q1614]
MGKAITNIKRLEVSKEEQLEKDYQEVKQALAENKDAIIKGIDLLKALEEGGTLNTLQAVSRSKKKALGYFVNEISKETYSPLLENLPQLFFLLVELDVKSIREVTSRLNEGVKQMNEADVHDKTSVFDMAKALKDPEINRSITMLMQFLKGMGRE